MGGVYSPRPMAGRRTRRKRHRGSVEELPRGTSACGYSPPSTRSAVASTTSARSRHAGILLYPFPATASLAPVLTASSRPALARRGSPLRSRPAPLPPVPLGVQVPPASRADCINRRGSCRTCGATAIGLRLCQQLCTAHRARGDPPARGKPLQLSEMPKLPVGRRALGPRPAPTRSRGVCRCGDRGSTRDGRHPWAGLRGAGRPSGAEPGRRPRTCRPTAANW